MRVKVDPDLQSKLKKLDVRIRNSFKEAIVTFSKNPLDMRLKNHVLKDEWEGYRAIHLRDPKNDYCAIYEEFDEAGDTVAYFVAIGTHQQLFKRTNLVG